MDCNAEAIMIEHAAPMYLWAALWVGFDRATPESKKPLKIKGFFRYLGGEGGIRTHGRGTPYA